MSIEVRAFNAPSSVLSSGVITHHVRLITRGLARRRARPRFTASRPDFTDLEYVPLPDELPPGQRWSTWDDIGIVAGPDPWPDWLITADAAIDTDLGILKTGKEADVILLERATDEESVIMAAKRYRSHDHRLFHRDSGYTEGRGIRRSRDRRAVAKGSRWGRQVEAGEWAMAEFGYLSALWSAGLPVPYPVQLRRHRAADGVHHPGRRVGCATAGPDPTAAGAARGLPRPAADRYVHDGRDGSHPR